MTGRPNTERAAEPRAGHDDGGWGDTYRGVPVTEALADLRLALTSRAIEDREISMQKQSRVHFQISSAGHEALGAGLARHLRAGHDWFFPYYRDRALCLGLGISPYEMFLQAVGSADDPSSAGRQMPSHWGNAALNVVTQSSPTGSQCLPAAGCAEATTMLRRRGPLPGTRGGTDEITYVSLGEGACSEGEFWESLNAATLLGLPLLFVVADNGWAISVPASEQSAAPVSELVAGFPGLAVRTVDGTDYFAVRDVAAQLIDAMRAGGGPALLHAAVTRPYSHSSADTQSKYRSTADLAAEAARDPVSRLEAELLDAGVLTEEAARELRAEVHREVATAASEALAAPRPDPAAVTDQVVARRAPLAAGAAVAADDTSTSGRAVVPLAEAIRLALHEQLDTDPRVIVFGEDVADAPADVLAEVEGKGGVFGITAGLQRTFGSDRCFNTPLAEAGIIGRAVGLAVRGLHPCPEIQFFDYIWPAMQQLRSEAATVRWRSNGAFTSPMVVRVAIGGYLTGGAIWHSQSGESIFAHVPGLLIAFPSRARDAVGLMRAAFQADDPVLFCEHKHLLRQPYAADPFPEPDLVIPFGKGDVRRRGDDLTLVTWGATVEKSLRAAGRAAEELGVETEVIDLRTIAPWDRELVAESLAATHRLLVVHEDNLTAGFGAEVAAWVGEHRFGDLDAPVARVGALDTHVAYEPTLEAAILPQVDDIHRAIVDLCAY